MPIPGEAPAWASQRAPRVLDDDNESFDFAGLTFQARDADRFRKIKSTTKTVRSGSGVKPKSTLAVTGLRNPFCGPGGQRVIKPH
jgi:hypothetical protein